MISPKIRMPAVAGRFYPASASALKKQIESFIERPSEKIEALGCILPHAGYDYSGKIAAEALSKINIKDKIILLGPNHTGTGAPYSIMCDGIWRTPLGDVKIDLSLAKKILEGSKYLADDTSAHLHEHSIEVELPFLQYFKNDFQIVPIAFMTDDLEELKAVGIEIARTVIKAGLQKDILLVASSDMTHYESQEEAKKKDKQAISAILELNEDLLFERIKKFDISMCGYAPSIAMISAAKSLGAKKAKLIKYTTSGETTGDTESVVGYAGIAVY